jgi:hypothetical protein
MEILYNFKTQCVFTTHLTKKTYQMNVLFILTQNDKTTDIQEYIA